MTEHGPDKTHPNGDAPTSATSKPKKKPRGNGKPPRGKKAPRPSEADMELRILAVTQLIIEGHRRRAIRRILAEENPKWPELTMRTVERYVATATAELSKIADEPRHVAKSKVRARYEMVIAKATKAEEWETVNRATRNLARLDGLEPNGRNQPTLPSAPIEHIVSGTVEHTHAHTHHVAGSIEDRASKVSELFGLAAQRRLAASHN